MMRILGIKRATSHAGGKRERRRDVGPVPVFVAAIAVLLASVPVSAVAQTPPPAEWCRSEFAP